MYAGFVAWPSIDFIVVASFAIVAAVNFFVAFVPSELGQIFVDSLCKANDECRKECSRCKY